jgi:hypothetical protein
MLHYLQNCLTRFLGATLVVCSFSDSAVGADIYIAHTSESYPSVVIEGKFERGDFERFGGIVQSFGSSIEEVQILSPGGNLLEAIKIGELTRRLSLRSFVPFGLSEGVTPLCGGNSSIVAPKSAENCTCASACFFAHIGAINRSGGYLLVHRPYFERQYYSELSATEAEKKFNELQQLSHEYLKKMDVPVSIIERIFATPPSEVTQISGFDALRNFIGYAPFFKDWINSKCVKELSDDDYYRYLGIDRRLARRDFVPEEDRAFYIANNPAYLKHTTCVAAAEATARKEGYISVFGLAEYEKYNAFNEQLWVMAVEKALSDLSKDYAAGADRLKAVYIGERIRYNFYNDSAAVFLTQKNRTRGYVFGLVNFMSKPFSVGSNQSKVAQLEMYDFESEQISGAISVALRSDTGLYDVTVKLNAKR